MSKKLQIKMGIYIFKKNLSIKEFGL